MGKAQKAKRRRDKNPDQKQQVERKTRGRIGGKFVLVCLLLVLATLAVYWQATKYPLINCDDRDYVTNNVLVKSGLTKEGLEWAFNIGYAGNWHPLTWMSHMLDARMFGSSYPIGPGARGAHITSLTLHVLNTLLLFLVLTRLTGYMWRSAFVAALFAIHPQHVESVAWVAERKDVLSTFFMMLALWGYAWYSEKPSITRYVPVVLAMALGLMAKPMLVTLPVLLLILDYWPLRRFANGWNWWLLWEKVPLFVLSAVSSILTMIAQSTAGAVRTMEDLSLGERIANAMMSYAIYLIKTFWPTKLAAYYIASEAGWPAAEVAGAVLLLAVITVVCVVAARKRPYMLAGWLWYVISLVPVIGFVQVGSQARADRYTYTPIIGIFLIVAFLVPDMLSRLRRSDQPSRWPVAVSGVAAVAVVAVMGVLCHTQVGYWKDGITVARRAIAVTKDNWFEEQSLGSQLQDEAERLAGLGRREEGLEIAQDAASHLRKSLATNAECADSHNDLGRALALMGDYEGAIEHYLRTMEIHPKHPLAPNNLGNTYLAIGRIDDALEQYRRALEINPRNNYAIYNMAVAYHTRGDIDAAIEHFLRVLELQPGDYMAYWARYNAAFFMHRKGDLADVDRLLQEAVQVNQATGVDPSNSAAKRLAGDWE